MVVIIVIFVVILLLIKIINLFRELILGFFRFSFFNKDKVFCCVFLIRVYWICKFFGLCFD